MRQMIMGLMGLYILLTAFPGRGADFDGDSRDDVAIFRPSSGLWAVRGVTRVYFGGSGDEPRPGDYNGDGISDIAINRASSGLWAVRGITRAYFGASGDIALQGGGGQRLYDYVVKWNDGTDLEQALESDTYDSVFIPAGDYTVSDPITVDHVIRITGESTGKTRIFFTGTAYLAIVSANCQVENLSVNNGGFINIGAIYVAAANVTVRDCLSSYSNHNGFQYTASADSVSLINCTARYATKAGFCGQTSVRNSSLFSCRVADIGTVTAVDRGFDRCNNLSNCYVDGEYYGCYDCNNLSNCYIEGEHYGFYNCNNLSSCYMEGGYCGFYNCDGIMASVAHDCSNYGFSHCNYLSSCRVQGEGRTLYGLDFCNNLSACHVESCAVNAYNGCNYDTGAVGHGNSCD